MVFLFLLGSPFTAPQPTDSTLPITVVFQGFGIASIQKRFLKIHLTLKLTRKASTCRSVHSCVHAFHPVLRISSNHVLSHSGLIDQYSRWQLRKLDLFLVLLRGGDYCNFFWLTPTTITSGSRPCWLGIAICRCFPKVFLGIFGPLPGDSFNRTQIVMQICILCAPMRSGSNNIKRFTWWYTHHTSTGG